MTTYKSSTRAFEKALKMAPKAKFVLRLYVAGATVRSREALRRVCCLCEAELKNNYELEVVDVSQQPRLAQANQIVATPTLIQEFPPPSRRFIGSLLNAVDLFGLRRANVKDRSPI